MINCSKKLNITKVLSVYLLLTTLSINNLSGTFIGEAVEVIKAVKKVLPKELVEDWRTSYNHYAKCFSARRFDPVSMNFAIPGHYVSIHQVMMGELEEQAVTLTEKKRKGLRKKHTSAKEVFKIQLSGVGGSGKTTFARSLAGSVKDNYSVVWELNGESEESFYHSIGLLTQRLLQSPYLRKQYNKRIAHETDYRKKQVKSLSFLQGLLKTRKHPWMLIIDNVSTDSDVFNHLDLINYNLYGRGVLLVTTTDDHDYPGYARQAIPQLTLPESFSLYSAVAEYSGLEEVLHPVFAKIPPYPLDVTLSAAYMHKLGLTPEQYLMTLETSSHDLAEDMAVLSRSHGAGGLTRQHMTINAIDDVCSAAPDHGATILFYMSLFDHADVPHSLIREFTQDISDKRVSYLGILSALEKQHLIEHNREDSTFRIHKSISDLFLNHIYTQMNDDQRSMVIAEIAERFSTRLLDANATKDILAIEEELTRTSYMLRRLNLVATEIDHLLLPLYSQLGSSYRLLGDYTKSEEYCNKVLATEITDESTKRHIHGLALFNLGKIKISKEDYFEAEALYQQALMLHEHEYGKESIECATVLDDLGVCHEIKEQVAKAKDLHEQSLAIKKKLCPTGDSVAIADSYHNLGNVSFMEGNYDQAKEYYKKCLVIYNRDSKSNSIKIAETENNLGVLSQSIDRIYDQALVHYKSALKTLEGHYGEGHIETVNTIFNIGRLFAEQRSHREAIEYFTTALAIKEEYFGEYSAKSIDVVTDMVESFEYLKEAEQITKYKEYLARCKANAE